jgi:4-hydroxy-2-oxoglutarate aldolase
VDVVVDLCKHPNIIGMKDSGGDIAKIGQLVYLTNKDGNKVKAGSSSQNLFSTANFLEANAARR